VFFRLARSALTRNKLTSSRDGGNKVKVCNDKGHEEMVEGMRLVINDQPLNASRLFYKTD
jgi:hypothetical protein